MPNKSKDNTGTQGTKRPAQTQSEKESVWEWIVAALGAVLVVSTLGFLLYDSFLGSTPPDITVELTNVQQTGDRFLVQFRATNRGGEGAAAVTIEGQLQDANGNIETANATISFIAAGSSQAGGLYFSHDPRTEQLALHALGYQEP